METNQWRKTQVRSHRETNHWREKNRDKHAKGKTSGRKRTGNIPKGGDHKGEIQKEETTGAKPQEDMNMSPSLRP